MVQRKMNLCDQEHIAECAETVGTAHITHPAFLQNEYIFRSILVAGKYRLFLLLL